MADTTNLTSAATSSTGSHAPGATSGKTTIDDTVVSKVAGIAAREVNGVHSLGNGAARAIGAIRDAIGQRDYGQGVKVEVGEKQVADRTDGTSSAGAERVHAVDLAGGDAGDLRDDGVVDRGLARGAGRSRRGARSGRGGRGVSHGCSFRVPPGDPSGCCSRMRRGSTDGRHAGLRAVSRLPGSGLVRRARCTPVRRTADVGAGSGSVSAPRTAPRPTTAVVGAPPRTRSGWCRARRGRAAAVDGVARPLHRRCEPP